MKSSGSGPSGLEDFIHVYYLTSHLLILRRCSSSAHEARPSCLRQGLASLARLTYSSIERSTGLRALTPSGSVLSGSASLPPGLFYLASPDSEALMASPSGSGLLWSNIHQLSGLRRAGSGPSALALLWLGQMLLGETSPRPPWKGPLRSNNSQNSIIWAIYNNILW